MVALLCPFLRLQPLQICMQKPKHQNTVYHSFAWNSLGLPNNFEVVFHRQGGLLPPQPRQAVDVEHQKTLFST